MQMQKWIFGQNLWTDMDSKLQDLHISVFHSPHQQCVFNTKTVNCSYYRIFSQSVEFWAEMQKSLFCSGN